PTSLFYRRHQPISSLSLSSTLVRTTRAFRTATTTPATNGSRSFTQTSLPKSNNNKTPSTTTTNNSSNANASSSTSARTIATSSSGSNSTGSTSSAAADAAADANAAQNKMDWKIFKDLIVYIWPKGDSNAKKRVMAASVLLVLSKLLNIQVPFYFKEIIDQLNVEFPIGSTVAMVVGAGIDFLLFATVFYIVPTALELTAVSTILAYNFGPAFAGVTLATMASYAWFTIQTTAWRTQFRKDANAADNAAATTVVDSLMNYESVKYFNNEDFELKQYDASLGKYEEASLKLASSLAYLNVGQGLIISTSLTAMMYMAAQGVLAGTMTVGDVVMANQLIFQLAYPLNYLGTVYRELRKSLIDMDAMFSLQRVHSNIVDKPGASELKLDSLTGDGVDLRFEDVYFGYTTERPILQGVSFVVPAGKKVAIVGPSGCGKSTLLRLLFRFYDPVQGNVYMGGQNVKDVTLKSLRAQISVVPQETALFNSTIMHNIRYGRVGATEEEVIEAAKQARIHDAIMALPDKYQTKVGERGLMLSGGEKQRVSLSRAILKNSPVMFFDEATSALDSHTEQGLLQNIRAVLRERKGTSLFIAHRLRTISDADEIIVLKEGKIAERGTHEQLLLQQDGLYRHMWDNQEGEARLQAGAE
ncbi:Iron-sulfur clusters transporter atm1, mitochondrial, partial [Podila humilis]